MAIIDAELDVRPAAPAAADGIWRDHFAAHRAASEATERELGATFAAVAADLSAVLKAGGTIFFCGNGGSAADAQHLAAELSVRFIGDRPALRAMALSTDYSSLTACGNDYGFEEVFARQIEALGRPGDALVAFTTSGASRNVVRALQTARAMGLSGILMTGPKNGVACREADTVVAVPARTTAQIQEMHITIGHALCRAIEQALGYGS